MGLVFTLFFSKRGCSLVGDLDDGTSGNSRSTFTSFESIPLYTDGNKALFVVTTTRKLFVLQKGGTNVFFVTAVMIKIALEITKQRIGVLKEAIVCCDTIGCDEEREREGKRRMFVL